MIKDLREEMYFGEDTPLVCDENGNFTNPVNFRKDFTEYSRQQELIQKDFIHFVTPSQQIL